MYTKEYTKKRIFDIYKTLENLKEELYGKIPYNVFKDLDIIIQDVSNFNDNLYNEDSCEWDYK